MQTRGWFDPVWAWVYKGSDERAVARSAWQSLCLARAKSCLTLAEHSRELDTPDGKCSTEAIGLLRWACRWLLAYDAGPGAQRALPVDHDPPFAGMDFGRWERLRVVLQRDSFEDATLPLAEAESVRTELASLAKDLVALRQRPERELAETRRTARLRVLVPTLLAASILGALGYFLSALDSFRPNLASGRPWKTSSTQVTCDPEHGWCGGAVTDIFFHTEDEASPWIEFDLGAPKWVRRVEVRNRLDCCGDRAVPLVVETSDEETTWAEVAHQDEPFEHWAASFPARQARYVRLRVARKSILHLEAVSIR